MQSTPHRASEDHYGCPYPRGFLATTSWSGEEEEVTTASEEEEAQALFWQRRHAEDFVRAIYLAARLESGRILSAEGLAAVMARPEAVAAVEGVVRRRGEAAALKEYERELAELIRKEGL